MSRRIYTILLFGLLACTGCGRKSTDDLIGDLKSQKGGDRVSAVRLLPQHKGDAAKVVPALVESLKDQDSSVRWSAAIGLGYFHEQAKGAIPALETAAKDHDPRVREGARVALHRIDPERFPDARIRDKGK
jgi:HEAT repeat protein